MEKCDRCKEKVSKLFNLRNNKVCFTCLSEDEETTQKIQKEIEYIKDDRSRNNKS